MESNDCSIRISDCSIWRNHQKKMFPDKNQCVVSCSPTIFPFEYLGNCHNGCPDGASSDENNKCYFPNPDCNDYYVDNFGISRCVSCLDSSKFLLLLMYQNLIN